jgi:hypothetical protein
LSLRGTMISRTRRPGVNHINDLSPTLGSKLSKISHANAPHNPQKRRLACVLRHAQQKWATRRKPKPALHITKVRRVIASLWIAPETIARPCLCPSIC